jgi:hypothetical protein
MSSYSVGKLLMAINRNSDKCGRDYIAEMKAVKENGSFQLSAFSYQPMGVCSG